jgi:galactose mutarotase-like enzyme
MAIALRPPRPTATLPDLSKPLGSEALVLQAAGGAFRVDRILLEGGRRAHVEMLLVDTGTVRAALLPTRGLGLWRANIEGLDCGWKSPVDGPVHPNWVAVSEPSGIGWLDGFDELLVRCGLRSFGAPDFDADSGRLLFPLHGRIANLPTAQLRVELDSAHSLLHISGVVAETRFLQYNLRLVARYTFALGMPTIEVHDTVENHGNTPTTVQMLYHVNIGEPLLEAGSQLHLAAKKVIARDPHSAAGLGEWSTYSAPQPGYTEQVYFSASAAKSDHWASTLLTSAKGDKGFAVHYDTRTLPFFTQWKNTVGKDDGYVTGLEPGTGFPNPRTFEAGQERVVTLEGGQAVDFHVKLEGLAKPERVAALVEAIAAQRGGQVETAEFDAEWCVPRN